jgi:predicted nucleic acid-binding protein
MKTVFAETGYWIALLDPQDTLHSKAINGAFAYDKHFEQAGFIALLR